LAFLYINNPYEISEKMLCMSKDLLDLQEKHRLDQKGIFKRYTITCYGHQASQQEMREEKSKMHEKLKNKIGTLEYNRWFFNYKPNKAMMNKNKTKTMNKNFKNFENDVKIKKMRKTRKKKPTFVNPYDTKKKRKFW